MLILAIKIAVIDVSIFSFAHNGIKNTQKNACTNNLTKSKIKKMIQCLSQNFTTGFINLVNFTLDHDKKHKRTDMNCMI